MYKFNANVAGQRGKAVAGKKFSWFKNNSVLKIEHFSEDCFMSPSLIFL